jgi:phenylalanyl-tRNA synthetase beta chain
VAELNLDLLSLQTAPAARFQPLPRFPGAERDLSILSSAEVEAETVVNVIRKAAGPALVEVTVTDRYDRPPVPAGKVSLLLSLRYEDRERTLTGDRVQASVDKVIRELRSAGFDIRGE